MHGGGASLRHTISKLPNFDVRRLLVGIFWLLFFHAVKNIIMSSQARGISLLYENKPDKGKGATPSGMLEVFLRDTPIFGGKKMWLALVNEHNWMLERFISSDDREMTYLEEKRRWNWCYLIFAMTSWRYLRGDVSPRTAVDGDALRLVVGALDGETHLKRRYDVFLKTMSLRTNVARWLSVGRTNGDVHLDDDARHFTHRRQNQLKIVLFDSYVNWRHLRHRLWSLPSPCCSIARSCCRWLASDSGNNDVMTSLTCWQVTTSLVVRETYLLGWALERLITST